MHVQGVANTTSAMVCELPQDPSEPMQAWAGLASPCVSVFVPLFPPAAVPSGMSMPASWQVFARLRDRVESGEVSLSEVRGALDPVEAELWSGAEVLAGDARAQTSFVEEAWSAVEGALEALSV